MSRSAAARLDAVTAPAASRRVAIPVVRAARPISIVSSQRERARSEGLPRGLTREEAVAPRRAAERDYRSRALALWPRLDAEKLRRTRGEALRIARLVERRTALPFETIVGMLTRVE